MIERPRAAHRRQHRDRARRRRRRARDGAARRRRRHVPRQGRRQRAPRRVRRPHAHAGDAPAGHGDRAAARRSRSAALEVAYQPIVQAATGRIAGFEALCRWPEGDGFVEPSEFLPIAEETGLIVPLGRWVLRAGVRAARRLAALPAGAGLIVGVNVSHRQLARPRVRARRSAPRSTATRPRPARAAARGLRARRCASRRASARSPRRSSSHGVRSHIDDFGTGASLAAPPAPLPGRRDEDPPRPGRRHGPGGRGVRDRQGARRARAQPRRSR